MTPPLPADRILPSPTPSSCTRIQGDIDKLAAQNPGKPVPIDMVTTSGSGLDPDITPDNAYYQAPRVAKARGLSEDRVRQLIAAAHRRPHLRPSRRTARQRARAEPRSRQAFEIALRLPLENRGRVACAPPPLFSPRSIPLPSSAPARMVCWPVFKRFSPKASPKQPQARKSSLRN